MKEIEIKKGTKYIVSNSIHSSFSVGEIVECIEWHPSGMSIYSNGKFSSYINASQLTTYKDHKEEVKEIYNIGNDADYLKAREIYPTNNSENFTKRTIFVAGANWQKEQTEALQESHDDLLETLKEAYKELKFHNWHNSTTGYRIALAIENAEHNIKAKTL